jgi:hypothetical protein
VLRPASNLQNTDYFCHSSFSTIQVSGVGCQEDTEASVQKTACDEPFGRELRAERLSRVDDTRKRAQGFLPSVIRFTETRHLTPETINIVFVKELN